MKKQLPIITNPTRKSLPAFQEKLTKTSKPETIGDSRTYPLETIAPIETSHDRMRWEFAPDVIVPAPRHELTVAEDAPSPTNEKEILFETDIEYDAKMERGSHLVRLQPVIQPVRLLPDYDASTTPNPIHLNKLTRAVAQQAQFQQNIQACLEHYDISAEANAERRFIEQEGGELEHFYINFRKQLNTSFYTAITIASGHIELKKDLLAKGLEVTDCFLHQVPGIGICTKLVKFIYENLRKKHKEYRLSYITDFFGACDAIEVSVFTDRLARKLVIANRQAILELINDSRELDQTVIGKGYQCFLKQKYKIKKWQGSATPVELESYAQAGKIISSLLAGKGKHISKHDKLIFCLRTIMGKDFSYQLPSEVEMNTTDPVTCSDLDSIDGPYCSTTTILSQMTTSSTQNTEQVDIDRLNYLEEELTQLKHQYKQVLLMVKTSNARTERAELGLTQQDGALLLDDAMIRGRWEEVQMTFRDYHDRNARYDQLYDLVPALLDRMDTAEDTIEQIRTELSRTRRP